MLVDHNREDGVRESAGRHDAEPALDRQGQGRDDSLDDVRGADGGESAAGNVGVGIGPAVVA